MRTIGIAMLAGALVGCSPSTPPSQACTLIGCDSGLTVVVDPTPAGSFRVEADAPGDSTRAVECSAQQPCANGAFFRDFTPESATIRVIVSSDTTTRSVTPVYEALQPNGPQCPPTCRQATVTVSTADADEARE